MITEGGSAKTALGYAIRHAENFAESYCKNPAIKHSGFLDVFDIQALVG